MQYRFGIALPQTSLQIFSERMEHVLEKNALYQTSVNRKDVCSKIVYDWIKLNRFLRQ